MKDQMQATIIPPPEGAHEGTWTEDEVTFTAQLGRGSRTFTARVDRRSPGSFSRVLVVVDASHGITAFPLPTR